MSHHLCLPPLLVLSLLGVAGAASTPTSTFPFVPPGVSAGQAAGQLSVRPLGPGSVLSAVSVRGLSPGTSYVAQYHALGAASADPCSSNGPVTLGFPAFRTNAQGQATVLLRAESARIGGTLGAYVEIRPAAKLDTVELCAAVLRTNGAPGTRTTSLAPAAAKQETVRIGDNVFLPPSLSVVAGTTVTWIHTGKVTHNVLSVDLPGIHSADLHPGDRYSYTFKTPGTFTYYCSYHEGMSATITVTNR